MTETYQQMQSRHQRESNERTAEPGIFVAFSDRQFEEAMEAYRAAGFDEANLVKAGLGYFGDRASIESWVELLNAQGRERDAAMADEEFAVGAYYYEMCNHEYGINWEGDWDVLRCFGMESLDDLKGDQRVYYARAQRRYWEAAEENGWL